MPITCANCCKSAIVGRSTHLRLGDQGRWVSLLLSSAGIRNALHNSKGRNSISTANERIFTLTGHSEFHVGFDSSWLVEESLVAERRVIIHVVWEESAADEMIAWVINVGAILGGCQELVRIALPLQEVVLLYESTRLLIWHGLWVTRASMTGSTSACVRPGIVACYWFLTCASSADHDHASSVYFWFELGGLLLSRLAISCWFVLVAYGRRACWEVWPRMIQRRVLALTLDLMRSLFKCAVHMLVLFRIHDEFGEVSGFLVWHSFAIFST